MISSEELHDQLTEGLDFSDAAAHEEFSERLDDFLEANNIDEADIISGESEYASTLSEAAFNGLDFSGMEGTGLSLADTHRIMNDKDHRLEMAEDYLTGNAESRIEAEHSELVHDPYSPGGPTYELRSTEGVEAFEEAVKIKEFMHYELRDALNAGPDGFPKTLGDFEQVADYSQWIPMLGDQAALHQNGGADDLKFIHPEDGRELVFDGDTKEIITEDRYMGTYNYTNATIPEDKTPGFNETLQNGKTEDSSLHTELDVYPWVDLGNTRADRFEHGGELGRAALLGGSVVKALGKGAGNDAVDIGDAVYNKVNQVGDAISDAGEAIYNKASEVGEAVSDKASEVGEAISNKAVEVRDAVSDKASEVGEAVSDKAGEVREAISDGAEAVSNKASELGEGLSNKASEFGEAVSDKADQAGEAIKDGFEAIKDKFNGGKDGAEGSSQEGALNPSSENMNGANIQPASSSEAATPTSSGTINLDDAIEMLAADQKTLNEPTTGEQASDVQDALNHPDAAEMFQNLQTHGVETLPAEITPDMSAEDRAGELLLAGREATRDAGIPMPEEQRELEATQEFDATQELNNSYEDDYSLGVY